MPRWMPGKAAGSGGDHLLSCNCDCDCDRGDRGACLGHSGCRGRLLSGDPVRSTDRPPSEDSRCKGDILFAGEETRGACAAESSPFVAVDDKGLRLGEAFCGWTGRSSRGERTSSPGREGPGSLEAPTLRRAPLLHGPSQMRRPRVPRRRDSARRPDQRRRRVDALDRPVPRWTFGEVHRNSPRFGRRAELVSSRARFRCPVPLSVPQVILRLEGAASLASGAFVSGGAGHCPIEGLERPVLGPELEHAQEQVTLSDLDAAVQEALASLL
eukprot:scaffold330_cov246-Pinguiococcus_pyrenoidosus.AAC.7